MLRDLLPRHEDFTELKALIQCSEGHAEEREKGCASSRVDMAIGCRGIGHWCALQNVRLHMLMRTGVAENSNTTSRHEARIDEAALTAKGARTNSRGTNESAAFGIQRTAQCKPEGVVNRGRA